MPYSKYNNLAYSLFNGKEIFDYFGTKINVNPGDNLGFYLYFFDDYENNVIDKLLEICKKYKVFLDVGANYGWISLAVSNSNNSIKIFSFEPDKKNYEEFNFNLNMNHELKSRINLVDKAVYDIDGTVSFKPSQSLKNPGISRIDNNEISDGYEVQAVSLDSFCLAEQINPDVVKIDVEGAELKVLKGMKNLLSEKKVKALIVEVHGFYYENDVIKFNSDVINELENHGYKIFFLDNEKLVPYKDEFNKLSKMHIFAYS